MMIDDVEIGKEQTFFLNLGAWPRSYNKPLDKTRKRLLKRGWEPISKPNDSWCYFRKWSIRLYVHFLGFAVVTGPRVEIDDIVADCGKKWLGNANHLWKKIDYQELDGSDWRNEVAQTATALMLKQLRDWSNGPIEAGGQVADADRLVLQSERIYELFPPEDGKACEDRFHEAKELLRRIRRNASAEYRGNMPATMLKGLEPIFLSIGTFFIGLGSSDGKCQIGYIVLACVFIGISVIICLVLKVCDMEETPILQLSDTFHRPTTKEEEESYSHFIK